MNTRIDEAADWLYSRRRAGQGVADMPAAFRPSTEAEAYALQRRVRGRLIGDGRGPQVGWKVGVTTPQMRAHIGFDNAIAAAVLAAGRHADGAILRLDDFCRLGIECEIAFTLARPLGGDGPVDQDQAAAAVAAVHPAIEIVDDRYGGQFRDFGALAIAADFAFHAGFILGPAVADWRQIDLAKVRGTARVDDADIAVGYGADVMGHPLASLAWLANKLAESGERIEAGQFVLTGSLPLPHWAGRGQAIEARFDGLGTVALTTV